MNAGSLAARDARIIANIGRLRFSPLSVVGGKGSYLVEEGGRHVLDLSSSAGAASLGYSHPAVVEAVSAAVANMAGASLLMYPNDKAAALGEMLLGTMSADADRRIWFGHSGSDANDCAVRVLHTATGRARFISFVGSYHGNVSGSMGISGHSAMTHTLPRAGLTLLPYPDPYRAEFGADQVLSLLDHFFETVCPPSQVAAVFMEPILSDGGFIVPPPGFLRAVQERCHLHGIRVVVDEVKVGLGRTGLLHCFEHEGIAPDLVSFGKGLGGGLPISALVGPAEIMDHAPAFALQTTAGNPVAAAAGCAVLDVVTKDGFIDHVSRIGNMLADGLRSLASKHSIIGDVRGRGLALGVELVVDRQSRTAVPVTTTAKIIYRGYELGAAFGYVGLKANVLEFMPPLTLNEGEAAEGLAILDQAILDVCAGKVSDEAVAPYMMW